MRILFVTGEDPRDTSFGSPQRNNRLFRALQQVGEVYAICTYPTEGKIDERIIAAKPIDRSKGIKRFINKVVNKFWFAYFPEARKIWLFPFDFSLDIRKEFGIDIDFDIVVSRYIDPAITFHLWNIAPLYVDIDDHPLETLVTRDVLEYPKWKRPAFAFLQKMIFHIVEKKMTGGWIANPEQVSWVKSKKTVLPLRNIPIYPSAEYNPSTKSEDYLLSVGFMQYSPNYLGIDSFLTEIWTVVKEQYPSLRYKIVGKGLPREYEEKWSKIAGVEYLGYVENLEMFYQGSLATVVAVDAGGGTCIKTLESLAYSRVCLSRPFGVRGVEKEAASCECGLFVYKTAEDFITLLKKYVLDKKQRNVSQNQAYQFVKNNYSEESFVGEVKKAISSL